MRYRKPRCIDELSEAALVELLVVRLFAKLRRLVRADGKSWYPEAETSFSMRAKSCRCVCSKAPAAAIKSASRLLGNQFTQETLSSDGLERCRYGIAPDFGLRFWLRQRGQGVLQSHYQQQFLAHFYQEVSTLFIPLHQRSWKLPKFSAANRLVRGTFRMADAFSFAMTGAVSN
jgi:hypothetical protein